MEPAAVQDATPRGWALVTGAASGIGLAIARRLSQDGVPLLLADRNDSVHDVAATLEKTMASASETASLKGGAVRGCTADLAQESGVRALAGIALGLPGGCGILVNCAGIHPKRDRRHFLTGEIALDDWEQVIRVNMTAPFLLCQALMPAMEKRGWGRVINIASRTGRTFTGTAGLHYTASKAGLIGMTRQLAGEAAASGVTVNCVAPGRIETPLLRQVAAERVAASVKNIPALRLGTPEEVAATVAFLASGGAAFISGACIDVNGGDFMG